MGEATISTAVETIWSAKANGKIRKDDVDASTASCETLKLWRYPFESSPRFQRYMSRREKAQAPGRPDPFNTHEVRIKRPSTSFAEKISAANPPPSDTEAYLAPKRTIKRFTDEIFTWKARLKSHGDLDKCGKNKRVQVDEREPPYSSLLSTFTGCSLDLKGSTARPLSKMETDPRAPHPLDKPQAAEVARRAMKQKLARQKGILAASITEMPAISTTRGSMLTTIRDPVLWAAINRSHQPLSAQQIYLKPKQGQSCSCDRYSRPERTVAATTVGSMDRGQPTRHAVGTITKRTCEIKQKRGQSPLTVLPGMASMAEYI